MLALLELIPRPLLLAGIIGLGALSGVQSVRLHFARAEAAEARSESADLRQAIAVANAEAANRSAALSAAVTKAQNDGKKREIDLRAAAAAAGAESDGLRDDITNLRDQLAGATRDAAAERAAAVAEVFGQCAKRYSELAASCDRHVNDIETLMQAWPRAAQ